ncbi:NUDIX hydrolase [bacterium]|nr:NUDIX hydrolase [bacterium]
MNTSSTTVQFFPATNGAVVNEQGLVLLTQRSEKVRAPGYWCLPGGHLDPGETWLDGCRRELREEVGIEVVGGELLGIYSDPATNVVPHPGSASGMGQFLTAVFIFRAYAGEIRPNEEVQQYRWVAPRSPPGPLISSHYVRLEDLGAFQGRSFFR